MSQKTDRVISEILQKRDRFTKNFRTENHGGSRHLRIPGSL